MTSPEFPKLEPYLDNSPLLISNSVFAKAVASEVILAEQIFEDPNALELASRAQRDYLDGLAVKQGLIGNKYHPVRLTSGCLYQPRFVINPPDQDVGSAAFSMPTTFGEHALELPSVSGFFFGFSTVRRAIDMGNQSNAFGLNLHYQVDCGRPASEAFFEGKYIDHAPVTGSALEFFEDKRKIDFNDAVTVLRPDLNPKIGILLRTLQTLLAPNQAGRSPVVNGISKAARSIRLFLEEYYPKQTQTDALLDVFKSKTGLYPDQRVNIGAERVFKLNGKHTNAMPNTDLYGIVRGLSYSTHLINPNFESIPPSSMVMPTLVIDGYDIEGDIPQSLSPYYVHIEDVRAISHS